MKKLVILALIGLMFLSVSVVSASDNATESLSDIEEPYNAEITAKDYTTYYDSSDFLKVNVKTDDGYDSGLCVNVVNAKNNKVIGEDFTTDGKAYPYIFADVGTYKAKISLADSDYSAKPVLINIKITKAPAKVTAYKWISTTKNHATLKATVKDKYGSSIKEGTVKFIVGGKSYTANVKNGVAKKSVKLTKARVYTYRAIFSSKNYQTTKASSKVYVKKAKSYYTFKLSKFTGKISHGKYLKLLEAKNNKKSKEIHVMAGKYNGRYLIHMYIDTFHRDMQYPKGDYIRVWVDTGMGMDSPNYSKKVNFYTLNP